MLFTREIYLLVMILVPRYVKLVHFLPFFLFSFWQFCTTPPVGILLGLRSKSLGWIPTVTIPNPDHPPLRILLTHPYFCTERKLNKHSKTTSSQQNPTKLFSSFSFPFHLLKLGFWWNEWLVTRIEKWKLTKTVNGETFDLAHLVYYQTIVTTVIVPKVPDMFQL